MSTMTTLIPKIDLQRFCATENARFLMTRPFVVDGWRYATDARICVRVRAATEPDDQPLPQEGELRFAPVAHLFASPPTMCPCPWPAANYIRQSGLCPQCNGKGDVGCDSCVVRECLVCKGSGFVEADYAVQVGEHFIAPHYDRLVRDLPNVVYYPPAVTVGGHRVAGPLAFRFDGGDGRVMGVRPPETKE